MTDSNALTILNDEYKNRFRTLFLEGRTIKEINEILEFNQGTYDNAYYLDKNGFRGFVLDCKKQYMLQEAERVSKHILDMKPTEKDTRLLQIQQKEAEFLRETQGKDLGYSKRIETIGLNLNKTEPLDEEQKKKLDKLFKKAGNLTKDATYVQVEKEDNNTDLTESQEDVVI